MLDIVLPPRCPGCGAIVELDHRFCAQCWMGTRFLNDAGCVHCARPIDVLEEGVCGPCLANLPHYDAVIAGVAYGDVARRMVLRLKYARRPGIARTIGGALAPRLIDPDAILVPVPLHRTRLWQRGFNQSAAIAKALGRRTGLRLHIDLVERTKRTPTLRGLNPRQRQKAVRGAFHVRERVDGAHIYLVDDVLTTGATANGCARALKRAGAAKVTLVCWARVLSDD